MRLSSAYFELHNEFDEYVSSTELD
jgi:hypothetical protein